MSNNFAYALGGGNKQDWVLGTTDDCDVMLVGSRLSGRIARLSRDGDVWTIAPLEGPVSVRGAPVSSATAIGPADDVRIGDVALPWPSSIGADHCYTVGRSRKCDIRIDLPGVSGRHAKLIVGFRGTYVLEDLDSTNGIYADAERRHRVRLIALDRDTSVYFGSAPINASDLLDAVPPRDALPQGDAAPTRELVPPGGAVLPRDVAAEQGDERTPKPADAEQVLAHAIKIDSVDPVIIVRKKKKLPASAGRKRARYRVSPLASGLVTLPVMIALVLWGKGFWQGSDEDLVTTPLVVAEVLALPNFQGRFDGPDGAAQTEEEATWEDVDPTEALFWVLVEVRQDNTTYRLGTAVAVDTDRLLTTGSIVMAGENLCEQLGGSLRVHHIRSGRRSDIRQTGVHPLLAERLRLASVAKQQFEAAGQESEPLTDGQERAAARNLELVNLSFSAASSADVGWLKATEDLKGISIDSNVRLRLRQSVAIYHSGFDNEDPFLDASASGTTSTVLSRIDEVAPTLQSIHGHGRIPLGPEMAGLNLFGSPVFAGGRLIGIVSYTDASDEGGVMAEFVAPSVLIQALNNSQ